MCGIIGHINRHETINIESFIKDRDRLHHRGPDDAGIWVSDDRSVALGQRRLSIIDLSPMGHQPMISDDERYIIVYNGELYNFKEVKIMLENKGVIFKSNCDTEVVLKAYIFWGKKCLNFFNGMFSLAIFDRGNSENPPTLFIARDRVGKKPLYYLHDANSFKFASELKGIEKFYEIDFNSLNFYLALGYIPEGMCIAKGINKLPPAHAGLLNLASFKMEIWKYWELPEFCSESKLSLDECVDILEELLTDSVSKRMISDVPLGIFLSGGMDSSLITAAAVRSTDKKIKTFNINFPGMGKYDESQYAQMISRHFNTEHYALSASKMDISILEELISLVDEPIADSSIIPTYIVSRLTRQHVTVALGGDGGDELFGGYIHYNRMLKDIDLLRFFPSNIMKFAGRVASLLPSGLKGRNYLQSMRGGSPIHMLAWSTPYFDPELRKRILGKNVLNIIGDGLLAPEIWKTNLLNQSCDPVNAATRTDFISYLSDDILVKVDRASMMNSLEVRAPFLDYRLVEFSFKYVPSNYKTNKLHRRIVEQALAKRMLPQQYLTTRKQGFSIPLDDWLRNDLKQSFREYLPKDTGIFNQREIESIISTEFKGYSNSSRLFSLFMLSKII